MFKKTAAVLLMVSGTAMASDSAIGFNNLSARYIDSDADGLSGDGYGMNLSFALLDYAFATIDYSDRSFDESGFELDLEFVRAGIGANWGFLEDKNLQVYGTLTWEQLDADLSGNGNNADPDGDAGDEGGGNPLSDLPLIGVLFGSPAPDSNQNFSKAATFNNGGENRLDGFGISTGVRYLVMDNVEVGAEYQFRDYDVDDESVMGTYVSYTYGDWQARLQYETYDKLDLDEISLGVAYIFGKTEEGGSSSIW